MCVWDAIKGITSLFIKKSVHEIAISASKAERRVRRDGSTSARDRARELGGGN